MLEKALERLLIRFLEPYVDGISRDSLRLGVFNGSLELKDLRIKRDALALLGYTTLRVKDGYLGTLRLKVPWKQLYSGKLSVSVEAFHFEVERIGDGASPASDEELIRQMRESKQKAIAVRASQLVDLVRQRDEEADSAAGSGDAPGPAPTSPPHAKKQGFVAKLIRKVVNNIHVEIEDARASFSNANSGLAVGLELGGLDVVSTDNTFQVPEPPRRGAKLWQTEVVVPDGALYKLLRLRSLGFRMAAAGVSDLTDAGYVLHPVSACLRLAHQPRRRELITVFEVARDDILELTLVRSQVKHLRASQAARGKEFRRLYRLMVPEAEEESLYQGANLNLAEYGALYERHLLTGAAEAAPASSAPAAVASASAGPTASGAAPEPAGASAPSLAASGAAGGGAPADGGAGAAAGFLDAEPLRKKELRRLQLFEDALSVGRLARRRVLVKQRLDALAEERRVQRSRDSGGAVAAPGAMMQGINSMLRWGLRRGQVAASSGRRSPTSGVSGDSEVTPVDRDNTPEADLQSASSAASLGFTIADRDKLRRDFDDESKFEEVDMPNNWRFEFLLGKLALDMIDDRWSREDQRQVLSLALEEARINFILDSTPDHHGRDASQWCLQIDLGAFHAFQAAQVAFRLCLAPPMRAGLSPSRQQTVHLSPGRLGADAASLIVASEMGKGENVLKLHFDFAPTEIRMPQGLVEEIREFIRVDLPPDHAQPPPPAAQSDSDDDDEDGDGSAGEGGRSRRSRVSFASPVASPEGGSKGFESPSLRRLDSRPQLFRRLTRTVSECDRDEQPSKVAEIMYESLPNTVGSRDRAHTLAKTVYARIPDKLELDVRIASPTFHVPVPGQGTTIFSLGMLTVQTPVPCEYSKLDLRLKLKEMVLCAETRRGERFDMFQPVLFGVQIQYHSTENGSQVTIKVQAEQAGVMLVPQSLQMLMATPFAMASVMWAQKAKEKQVTAPPTASSTGAEPDAAGGAEAGADGEQRDTPRAGATATGGDQAEAEDEQPGASAGAGAVGAGAAAEVEAPAPPVRQFTFSMTMQFDALDLTLADSIVPVMVWHMRWRPPGLQIDRHRLPHPKLTVDLAFAVEVDILNTRNNAWEPLVERFDGGFLVDRESPSDGTHTKVTISGRDQLLLNLKPTMIRRVAWYLPVILTGLTFQQELVVTSSDAQTADVSKYRVVNLCNQALELEFKSCHRANLVTRIEPTGSKWEHLDKWVSSPYFATALVVRLPGGESSLPLSLEYDGAVAVPNSGLVAELLSPSPLDRTQHRMLLLATSLRVHNETDLPLLVRFHTADTEVLALPMPPSTTCDGALLGHFPKEHLVPSDVCGQSTGGTASWDGEGEDALVLPPNAFGAVPLPALIREQGADLGVSHAWLSVRPAAPGFAYCPAVEVGVSAEARTICSRRVSAAGDVGASQHHVYLFCEAHMHKATAPSPITLTTIAIQAPLAFINALPFGDLVVGYGPKSGEVDATSSWQEARVPSLKHLKLYNFPGMLLQDGIFVRARFASGAPWSPLVHFGQGAFRERGAVRDVQLRQSPEGAAGGVVLEHADGLELRFSCPFWFVDRSGLPANATIRMLHRGHALPTQQGITLLPSKCQEEDCELSVPARPGTAFMDCTQVMLGGGRGGGFCSASNVRIDRSSGNTMYKLRMPPNFSIHCLDTRAGPGVFCVQAEDVNRRDMLGAECQMMKLCPRLILTNSSDLVLEVSPVDPEGDGLAPTFQLAPRESRELHWEVRPGDEDAPSTNVWFRPVCYPPCQWPGAVVCSDATAGSRPFLMLAGKGRHNTSGKRALGFFDIPQVWSAEVAPMRGALAVSFRVGSTFAAVNRSKRVQMIVHPLADNNKALADIMVPQHGQEVPYGWSNPFLGVSTFGLRTNIGGRKFFFRDVRKPRRKQLEGVGVMVTISRVGTKTVLAIDDHEASAGVGARTRGKEVRSALQIDVKLNHLGISLIEELPQPREALYVHLGLIRFEWQKDSENDSKRIKFLISEIQVDCQLPGRLDAKSLDHSLGLLRQDRPVVILANCGHGDRMFLELTIEQGATSSADIMIPSAELALDRLDFIIDDGWVDPLVSFARQCRSSQGGHGVRFGDVARLAGHPAIDEYSPPALPSVVQVESLRIAQLKLTLWCSLKLRSAAFLPPYLRDALRVLSFSDELTLEDATLSLPEVCVPRHCGSLRDFLGALASVYINHLLRIASVALGKSSLLNLPRAPLRIGGTTVSYLTETMGLVAGEAASLMNHLTFDDEYVARQRQIRSQKQITGFAEGMHEAGRSLGQGIEGVLDVVKKPAEGWKAGGLQGAVVGVGQGVASGIFKPISNIGQAISDVGAGISATVGPDTAATLRRRARQRLRLPRLLFSDAGVIRPWSGLEAELLWQLGGERMQGVQEALCLAQDGPRHIVLLLYTYHLALVEIEVSSTAGGSSSSGGGGGSGTADAAAGADGVGAAGDAAASGGFAPTSSMGGRGSGAPGAEDVHMGPEKAIGILGASGGKIFWQAMKPVTKLVKGLQELNQGTSPKGDGQALKSEVFNFRQLQGVVTMDDDSGPTIELRFEGGHRRPLPLHCGPNGTMGEEVRRGLFSGFESARTHLDGAANWGALRKAICEEQVSRQEAPGGADGSLHRTDAGQLTLEVFEVERWMLMSSEWQTPCLPTEDQLKWRWVDSRGYRHPHLLPKLSRKECAARRRPPCELDAIFTPIGEWAIEKGEGTDEDGWSYGISWKSSTWDKKPGLFDVFRKRKWQRTYR